MIKGILFDKDGTLIDFDKVWVPTSKRTIENLLKFYECDQEYYNKKLESLVGIRGSVTIPDSLLAERSLAEITEFLLQELEPLKKKTYLTKDKIAEKVINDFHKYAFELTTAETEICNLKSMLSELNKAGMFLGIASQDDHSELLRITSKLEIDEYLSYIGGFGAVQNLKPEADMAIAFANQVGIKTEEIAVVGDLKIDIEFAKNSKAIAIGVLSGLSTEGELKESADYLLDSVETLPWLLGKIGNL